MAKRKRIKRDVGNRRKKLNEYLSSLEDATEKTFKDIFDNIEKRLKVLTLTAIDNYYFAWDYKRRYRTWEEMNISRGRTLPIHSFYQRQYYIGAPFKTTTTTKAYKEKVMVVTNMIANYSSSYFKGHHINDSGQNRDDYVFDAIFGKIQKAYHGGLYAWGHEKVISPPMTTTSTPLFEIVNGIKKYVESAGFERYANKRFEQWVKKI